MSRIKSKAQELLSHRGPDDEGVFEDNLAYMLFFRLSIMDPSDLGHQPMVSSCGRYVMTFNGEIYNFRDLSRQYDLTLKSQSDSEVLLELYARMGVDILQKIQGMYAFIIYDTKTQSFFGARDSFGIKPLYYVGLDNGIAVASEIKPLLWLKGRQNINKVAIMRYLLKGELDDQQETFFSHIKQVPPGYGIEGNVKGCRLIKVNKLSYVYPYGDNNQDRCRHDYHELLIKKVDKYLDSDVPVGVSLSGGFDSSLLAYLVHANAKGQDLHMFSRGYADFEGNELAAARQVGKKFHFQYHEAVLHPHEVPQLIIQSALIQEQPVTSISVLAFHKLYKVAKQSGLKVLLEGHGGDEIWAGYKYYSKLSEGKILSQDGSSLEVNRSIIREEILDKELSYNFNDLRSSDFHNVSPLTRMQLSDMYGGKMQRSLRYVDRASMHEGIEVRLPFLDEDVVEKALRIPDDWKIKGEDHRYFVRKLAREYLGEDVAFRLKVPVQDPQRIWLRTSLREYVLDMLHSKHLFIGQFVNIEKLVDHFSRFIKTPAQYSNLTFVMFPLCLEAWYAAMNQYLNVTESNFSVGVSSISI